MKIKLNDVRIAFPVLFEPKAFGGGTNSTPDFSAAFLFPPDHPQVGVVSTAIRAAATEKWGARAEQILKELKATGKLCLQRGDSKASYEGYEGNLFINARSKTRPLVIDRDTSMLTMADGKPYAGCYVNVSLEIWAQENQFGKRINASLKGVQFLRDGDAFSGVGSAATPDEFEDLSAGASAGAASTPGSKDDEALV